MYNPLSYLGMNEQPQGLMERISPSDLQAIIQAIAGQGQNGDTMLAHINPQEADLLKSAGGSGTTNPETGLPQFASTDSGSLNWPQSASPETGDPFWTNPTTGYLTATDPSTLSSMWSALGISDPGRDLTGGEKAAAQQRMSGIMPENTDLLGRTTGGEKLDPYGWYTPENSSTGQMVNNWTNNYVPGGTVTNASTVGTPYDRGGGGLMGFIQQLGQGIEGIPIIGPAVEFIDEQIAYPTLGKPLEALGLVDGVEDWKNKSHLAGLVAATIGAGSAIAGGAGGAEVGAVGAGIDTAETAGMTAADIAAQGAPYGFGAAEGGEIGGSALALDEFNSPYPGEVTTWPTEGTGIPSTMPLDEFGTPTGGNTLLNKIKGYGSSLPDLNSNNVLTALMLTNALTGGGSTENTGSTTELGRTAVAESNAPGAATGYNPDLQSMWDRIASSGGGQNLDKQMLASILGQYPNVSSGGQSLQDLLYGSRAGTFA